MRVAVIIPALNEEQGLARVLTQLPPVDQVIVVDNGSSDGTAATALQRGATVCFEPRRGYGSAVSRGLALLTRHPPDVVVVLDADGSDYPEELPLLLQPLREGRAEMVIGSRTLGHSEPGAMPVQQRFGNWLTNFLIYHRYGIRFTDLGPFRAIDYQALVALDLRDLDFGFNVEMQLKAARRGFRITEVPVRYRRRVGKSKISGTVKGTVGAGIKILTVVLRGEGSSSARYPSRISL